ncbi:MAG: magnesium transporter CorA family protein [Lachnospiraceae bacterium]|nr:magnesium transporter CorA family protein [Lachnospiraceae bacterium]
MITLFKTDNGIIREVDNYETDIWIKMTSPSNEEANFISEKYGVDLDHIKAALDNDESARIEIEDDYTLILVDIPVTEKRGEHNEYTTIPLGIILCEDTIITICARETNILKAFVAKRIKEFSTKKRMRFLYQILYRNAVEFQVDLRKIDKKRTQIEGHISEITEDSELIELHELESNLVYFATSLRANGLILERLTRYSRIKQYPEDRELLEDVIIENKQAIEMTQIYRDIINGTRELMSTVINNRLNNVMKYLASITIVMSIPTIISGLYGMNVSGEGMPLSGSPWGFGIICGATLIICVITMIVLKKRKML